MNPAKKEKAHKILQIIISFFGTMAAAAFSPLFMFFQNAGEAHFSDVAPTMLIFMAVGLVLYAITFVLTKKPSKAGIISIAFLVAFLNYAHIESAIQIVLPTLKYWHILPSMFVVLLLLSWLIWKKLPKEFAEVITSVITVVFCALIILNGTLAVPAMTTRIQAEKEAMQHARETVASNSTMPNFYFILFDEFSTIPFMQKHFNYDNSQMVHELEKMGFNVSNSGYNYTASTSVVTTNMFNLDYVVFHDESEEVKFARRSNNIVFPMLKEAGYSIEAVIGGPFYGLNNVIDTGSSTALTISGETAHALLMNMTAFYPNAEQYFPEHPRQTLKAIDYMKNPNHFDDSNQFILFHVECPHTPFFFNADGSLSSYISSSWADRSKYLNQYIFATSEMLKIVGSITKNDPDAIVWLLSDHGARVDVADAKYGTVPYEDMYNFFNAVYYKGEKVDIEGLSGVNTFRLILNKLLGTNYEDVPTP